jgi:hypothetical protein
MKGRLALVAAVLLAGCPGEPPARTVAPPPAPATASVASASATGGSTGTELVPLDAVDAFELPDELSKLIARARAKVPLHPSPEEARKLDDLESRSERLEAALLGEEDGEDGGNSMRQGAAIARVLAGYYWERLRIWTPELPAETPEELVTAFERGH